MTDRPTAVDLHNTSAAYYAPATVTTSNARLVHISGQPGSASGSGHVPSDYESQIHLALLNLRQVITAAGATIQSIVKLTLFIVNYDPNLRQHTRHIQKFLQGHRPAITLIPVTQLAVPSWLFEVDAVLQLPDSIPKPISAKSAAAVDVDVIVIGAGLAGLTAARDVVKNGLSCVVLEARDRVGGKTWSQEMSSGGAVDLGAAWINDTNQSKIYELAVQFGAEIIEQNTEGKCVLQDAAGRVSTFPYGSLPELDATSVRDIARIRDMCEEECQALSVDNPRDTHLDTLTFEAYLRSRGASAASISTATVWTRAMLGQDPKDISALYFLNYCKSGGGLLQMRSDRKGGGQHLRVRQGMQLFSKGLASKLPSNAVRLCTPVKSVTQKNGLVIVGTESTTLTARKLITTVPTPVLRSISFEPRLPAKKQIWIDSTTYGYYTKAMMVFKKPFWVENGYCGLVQSFIGPASVIRDTCSPADKKYVLTCFMSGEPGKAWAALSTPQREQALVKQIGQLYNAPDVASDSFVEMVTYEWVKDEYSGWGCPCTSLTPGVLDLVGGDCLREAWDDVHFAGTETAGDWKGYMEGAVRSGERAAAEVVKALKHRSMARL